MSEPLLQVRGLRLHFESRAGRVQALDGVDFDVAAGEIVGLVGESGSGKSQTGNSIMGLLDGGARIDGGSIRFQGRELIGLPGDEMRRLRGNRIAMVFQDPMMTLDPVLRIGTQMVEAIQAHRAVPRAQALDESLQALQRVGIAAAAERLRAYPHELSGGMRQRVVIAIAMLNRPALLIADEPTTALDVTIQNQILHEARQLCRASGVGMIWITHDLAVVASLADRVCVMQRGRVVEAGSVDEVLDTPRHPYTRALLAAVPSRPWRGRPAPGIAAVPGTESA